MKIRRKRPFTVPLGRRPALGVDVCPYCGHTARRGEGRIIDPVTRSGVCVRCGSEIRTP